MHLFLCCFFEIIKHFIIGRLKELYCDADFNTDKSDAIKETERYKKEVKSLARDPLYASIKWFQNRGALSQEESDIISSANTRRCYFVHELSICLMEGFSESDITLLHSIINIYYKLDSWWVYNIDFPDEIASHEKIKQGDCISSTAILHKIIFDVITGNDEKYFDLVEQIQTTINKRK